MMKKIKLTSANKSITLKALAPYYYRERALGHITQEVGKLILKQLLTLGIPNSTSSPFDNMDLKLLQSYGFKIYDCSTDAWLEE